jgi:hypothetical protein
MIAACEFSTAPLVTPDDTPGTAASNESAEPFTTPVLAPSAPPQEAFLAEAAAGSWRPAALPVTAGFLDRTEAACVAAEPELEGLPVSVRELRGEDHVALIFGEAGGAPGSYLCRGSLEATTAAELDVVALGAPAEPVGDEELDLVRYESLTDDEGDTRIVAIGRVGRLVDRVVAGFPDESEVEAAKGGGWWAMWWPGSETTITIAAVNRQSLAIDSLAPDGSPTRR